MRHGQRCTGEHERIAASTHHASDLEQLLSVVRPFGSAGQHQVVASALALRADVPCGDPRQRVEPVQGTCSLRDHVCQAVATLDVPKLVKQHDANGRLVAAWLAKRLGEERVFYPGLASHPQHELAKRQMSGFGGMVSIETGSKANANTVVTRLKLFTLAESLGGVESLVCQPAGMTHASVEPAKRAELGISDGLLRFSCGIEEPEDLLEDLEQAFKGL